MRRIKHFRRSKGLVGELNPSLQNQPANIAADAKAKAEMAAKAKGSKGPLNTGSQGIKKSGKK
jgi:hypothetical protein